MTWVIANPSPGRILGPYLNTSFAPSTCISYVASNTNCVYQIRFGAPQAAGTNLLTMSATATTAASTAAIALGISSGNWIYIDIASTSGTPDQLTITLY